MIDTFSVLIKPYNRNGHSKVTVVIDWGDLPSCVRSAVGTWKPLQYACKHLAQCETLEQLQEGFTVDMQRLMEEAASHSGLPMYAAPEQLALL